jgi:tetratricopeptide (TPR) repeat protein
MKNCLRFLILIAQCTIVQAGSIEFSKTDRSIIASLFAGEWQKSDSLVNLELGKTPDHPKYYFLKAYTGFYSRFVSQRAITRDQSIDLVKEFAWKAILAGQKLPPSVEVKFYTGCAYGFLCRINSMRQEYWLTYWNARKCQKYLNEVLQEDVSVQDAYMGLALIEYFPAAAMTGYRGALAWLGGMSGSREKGLQYFERVAEKGILFQDEALYALTIVYRFGENNVDKALTCWKEISGKYPSNMTFAAAYHSTILEAAINVKGVKFLEEETATLKSAYEITNAGILNGIGYRLMNQQKYTDALVVFQVNVKLFPEVANGYDSLAECFMNLKDNQNAVKQYKIASEKLAGDTTVTEIFRQSLRTSIAQKLKELDAI